MPFPEAFLEELNEKNRIEDVVGQYVTLTRRGSNLFGLCPFHNEKTASFSVAPEKGIYYCFGCHKGGGAVNFIMEIEGLEYPDAIRFLAKRAGIEVPEDEQQRQSASSLRRKEKLWQLCRDAARYYHNMLKSPEGQEGLQYLLKRGLTQKTITRFGLGFAPNSWDSLKKAMLRKGYSIEDLQDAGLVRTRHKEKTDENGNKIDSVSTYDWFRNRVMYPIIDVRGNVIGFGGRVMDNSEPKYLNSPESMIFNKRKNLFALNYAKKSKLGMIVLTEGYMDTISMHQYGFDCAVASLGTSLTKEQAGILAKYTKEMVLCYDGDEAGQNAAKRAIGILEQTGINVRVLRMQGAKDPDEFLKKFGAARFQQLLGTSQDQAVYQLDSIRRKYDMQTDDGKVNFLKEAAELISSMSSSVEREVYSTRAAEMAGIRVEAMTTEVSRAYRKQLAQKKKKEEKQNLQPAAQAQPSASGIRYDNVRSAMAEEGVISQLLIEPNLVREIGNLTEQQFSAPLLGRVYAWIRMRAESGLSVSIAAMSEVFNSDEISHIVKISNKMDGVVNEEALADYIAVIMAEAGKRESKDLMTAWKQRRSENA